LFHADIATHGSILINSDGDCLHVGMDTFGNAAALCAFSAWAVPPEAVQRLGKELGRGGAAGLLRACEEVGVAGAT